ncbi:MAG TPA: TolC family protein [Gemmatimonadaceae bacterium]|nr:TolC family protein [Gemmatimonadaceae bacterium]
MRRATATVALILCAGCVARAPRIDGAPGASPTPQAPWVPPAAVAREVGDRAQASSAAAAAASSAASEPLSLTQIVDVALRNNPATRLAWSDARAAENAYGAERGSLLPAVTGSATLSRSRSPNTVNRGDRTQYTPSISLSYLVLDFGGRTGLIESARQTAIAADFTHNAAVQNTILDAEAAAFSYLATRALRDAQRTAINESDANLAAATERHRVGLATIADELQARTARAQAELDLETLEGQFQTARGALATAMGLPVTTSLELPGIETPDSAGVRAATATVDSIIQLAVRSRPDLAAAEADVARAAADVRVARSAGLPSLSFVASGGYVGANPAINTGRTYALTFGLSVPIFSGFSHTYDVRAATARRDAADARAQLTRQQIAQQVFTAFYQLQTATERVRTSATLLSSATESEQVARGRYNEGVGSIVDLLIAQTALANARAQSIAARWQWRIALAQLAHDAGSLGPTGESVVPITGPAGNNR